jgi:response regulator NasT
MSYRIIIADDESLIRTDLKELLEDSGHSVIAEARDGKEALELVSQNDPDIVILDIKMPELDGIDVANLISKQYPVIILTAYSESHLIERARTAGVMAYLSKPFREEDLSPAIELAVSQFLEKSALADRVIRLKEKLEVRKMVDHAKVLIMEKEHLSEGDAYRHIQKISMNKNKPIKAVAEAIILMYGR